jgi:hypothetical protein
LTSKFLLMAKMANACSATLRSKTRPRSESIVKVKSGRLRIGGKVMTTGELLLNIGVLAFVLASGLGTRALTRRRFRLPIVLVVIVGFIFLRSVPTAGNDVAFDVILGLVGVAFGALASCLMAVSRDRADGSLVTKAAAGYAALWIAVIGGRILFAYGSDHWFAAQIATFSREHAITGSSAWTAAFVIMAIAMVAARVAVTGIKAGRIAAPSEFLARRRESSTRHANSF